MLSPVRGRRVNSTAGVMLVAITGLVLVGAAFGFGSFKSAGTLDSGGSVYAIVLTDLNGDGKKDLVAGNGENDDDHVSVYPGKKNGKFGPEVRLEAGAAPEGVSVGDINGDRRKDIVAANFEDSTISIFLQRKKGTFKDGGTLPGGPGSWLVELTDLNRDKKLDMVVGNYDSVGDDAVSVLLGKGNGKFKSRVDYAAGAESYGIAVGKMNGDKRPDVVSTAGDGTTSVLLTKRNGTLKSAIQRTAPGGDSFDPALGDFNGDRKRDVAAGNYDDGTVMVFLGNGKGKLKAPISTSAGELGPNGHEAGDFNRDGELDLAVALFEEPYGLAILRGKGDGSFKPPKVYPGTDIGYVATAGRINGDKGLDVIVGTETGLDLFFNKR